ncbi:MAG TPA: glycosyltransferase family A protein [Coleofasciculaceae cyanobacterium]|jgi:glycosyltransferase involved in cell wall biosynthesis
MKNNPLVSGIIIFLNGEKFIEEAIESVFAQTYDHWELLLVDDGSTDGSTAIAKRYAQQYPDKVRYLEHQGHQNRGMSATRNLGICNAKGDYIAFLDADDIWLPQKLQQQVAILEAHSQAGMVYGPTQYWYSWTGNPQDIERDYMARLGVQPNTLFNPPTLLTLYLTDPGSVPCTCGLLVRRQLLKDIGGFDERFRGMYEDQVFLAKICLKAPVFVDGGCWDKYRQHPDSSSQLAFRSGEDHPSKPNPARQTFLTWLAEYVGEQGIKDNELCQAVQKALWPYRYPIVYRLSKLTQYLVWQIKRPVKLIARQTLLIKS